MLKSLGRLAYIFLSQNPLKEREARLYGGQAIIEGVMMKGPTRAVAAVRTPDGRIISQTIREWHEKKDFGWRRILFIRGIFILIDSLTLGIAALRFSVRVAFPEEEGEKTNPIWESLSFTISILIAVGLFVIFPTKFPEWVGLKAHGEIL